MARGDPDPTGDRAERLVELSALIERLTRVVDPSYIPVWLRKPVPALEDDKPLDVIGRGDYRRVAALVSALEESPTTWQVDVATGRHRRRVVAQVPHAADPLFRPIPPATGAGSAARPCGALYFADSERDRLGASGIGPWASSQSRPSGRCYATRSMAMGHRRR